MCVLILDSWMVLFVSSCFENLQLLWLQNKDYWLTSTVQRGSQLLECECHTSLTKIENVILLKVLCIWTSVDWYFAFDLICHYLHGQVAFCCHFHCYSKFSFYNFPINLWKYKCNLSKGNKLIILWHALLSKTVIK